MRPTPRNLQQIGRVDLERLIEGRVPEDQTLDYKQDKYQRPEEFCKDISAIANTDGGVILLGIREEQQLPIELVGIEDAADEQQRLTQAAEANIRPRVLLSWKVIALENGRHVLGCATQKSRLGPHMNRAGNDKRFHKRAGEITTVMDERELRTAFLYSRTQEEIVLELHRSHCDQVLEQPDPGRPFPVYVFDVLPVPVDVPRFNSASEEHVEAVRRLNPALGTDGFHRISFDGWVTYSCERRDKLRIDHRGCVSSEAEEQTRTQDGGRGMIASVWIVQNLFRFYEGIRSAYRRLGIEPPVYLCWTILRSGGLAFAVHIVDDPLPVDVPKMEFPPILWEDLSQPAEVVLRPWLDRLWQAFGLLRCSFYDDEGNFQPQ